MGERTSNILTCLFCFIGNNGQTFHASHHHSTLLRHLAGLLHHRHILQEERGQDGNSAEHEDRYEAVLDSEGERELERREYLVEQVLSQWQRSGHAACREVCVP